MNDQALLVFSIFAKWSLKYDQNIPKIQQRKKILKEKIEGKNIAYEYYKEGRSIILYHMEHFKVFFEDYFTDFLTRMPEPYTEMTGPRIRELLQTSQVQQLDKTILDNWQISYFLHNEELLNKLLQECTDLEKEVKFIECVNDLRRKIKTVYVKANPHGDIYY